MRKSIIEIKYKKKLYALIIRRERKFIKKGVDFVTRPKDLIQLGFLNHNKSYHINSHIHLKKPRIINYCTEVLLIEKGKVKIIFYDSNKKNIHKDKILKKGDIIILFQGGHGFKIMGKTQIIEIKQGPYIEDQDKTLIEK
tara:strand:+ start:5173 stop:5592 length:420 start_codon:yes stop_codon:yes gene_type:complete